MEYIIRIKDLWKRFGDNQVLKGVNLDIVKGKTTVILGLSGGGKSTIIKHIVRLLKPDRGEVWVDDVNMATADEKTVFAMRKKIGYLFQSGALFDSMNVYENVSFPLREHTNLSEDEIRQRVEERLVMVGLEPKTVLKLYPDELSGGMRKRVGLARSIVLDPGIILYDEPTSGLDPITSDLISQLIKKTQENLGVTSVLISHDIKESFKCGDYFAMLYDGKIIEYGDKEHFQNSTNPYVRQFLEGKGEGPIKIVE
ncbi:MULTISPECIES: ABC transporter ATP-binding protein [unclassified Nitratiruptor]|uniref:ABC transporter ATP-binding protein n=1 Tax=unclassified Nitratiruptor TaxID=2624044 RepID=UPI0019165606|nr:MULTISPECIES: ABC transporter ATP-binding protein [unclassified Nitratiruptor]BCD60250.1 phospholipid/cholesterol/gamma-HCH transport system ATP-binding protein [Nitratiruptor sp. YY08-10]BCD64261.1 phospholipid/cholesterol/gamma-HCH transport system ATP-binding protein [Nitratiruptor sp. YY08-14]